MTLWGANHTNSSLVSTPTVLFNTPFGVVCTLHFLQRTELCMYSYNWGEPKQAPPLRGERCTNDCGKKGIATHYCSFGRVVHIQTNTINLRILSYSQVHYRHNIIEHCQDRPMTISSLLV